ncbi:MAG: hypothetical protein QXZ44_01085 [Ferroplasma sp.]
MHVNPNDLGYNPNNTILSIGNQNDNVGNYSNPDHTTYQISGVGVSGFLNYKMYTASVRSFNSTLSVNLRFNVSSSTLVLIMIAAGGSGSINITSGPGSLHNLYDFSYSEHLDQVNASAAAYAGNMSSGKYSVTINSTMDTSANSGTGGVVGAIAYVFNQESAPPKSTPPKSNIELYAIIGVVVAVVAIGSALVIMKKKK